MSPRHPGPGHPGVERPGVDHPGLDHPGLDHAAHLVRRFVTSLPPGGPPLVDEAWAGSLLDTGEWGVWRAMSGPDRRHSVSVARRAAGTGAEPDALVAALLHDVGKLRAGLGTFGRVAATLLALAGGRARLRPWAERGGWRGRFGRYLEHDRLGAEILSEVGARELAVRWAAEHHRPPGSGAVPEELARLLQAADGD
ncbi:MAG: HD domain-containing protein [Acidimicrobiales bacterium]